MRVPKTILVFVRSAKYLKAMKSVVAELSARGFGITAVYDPGEGDEASLRILENFKRELPAFSYTVGLRRRGVLKRAARTLRGLSSYGNFVRICGTGAFYTRHWRKFLPDSFQHLAARSPSFNRLLASLPARFFFACAERLLPADRGIMRQIRALNPSAVLVAYRGQPPGSPDSDYLKAAKKLGIPTIISVASWDSLTTKGKIHLAPRLLLVWNEKQKQDAIRYHGLKSHTIQVVGAFQFDEWFALRKDTAPERKEPRALLYVASGALSGDNLSVPLLLRATMNRDVVLRGVPLIVRPPLEDAPKYQTNAAGISLEPRSYEGLGRDESAQLFLRSIGASFAAIGVHTTGLIDALIKGLPTIIYSPPEFRAVQEVPHFRELIESGAAYRAANSDELAALARALYEGRDEKRAAREAFIASLRPRGAATPAASFAAEEIEKLLKKRYH